jgi:hypothetical protein
MLIAPFRYVQQFRLRRATSGALVRTEPKNFLLGSTPAQNAEEDFAQVVEDELGRYHC